MTGVYKPQLTANFDTISRIRRRNSLCNPPRRRRRGGEMVQLTPMRGEKGPEREQEQEEQAQHRQH